MLCIVGASGKLGTATLSALLDHKLIPPEEIVCTTSSQPGEVKLQTFKERGVKVRSANWDSQSSLLDAFQGCSRLFLISSSRISKDFGDRHVAPGRGREADHFNALEAAKRAGIQHVYYTSLAFAKPSLSRVMTAHERTEDWLHANAGDMKYTIIREGIYSESWPLYLGNFDLGHDSRATICLPGDGKISWTSIADLGLANALILVAPPEEWAGQTCYLSQRTAHTLKDVGAIVSKSQGEIEVHIVSKEEYLQASAERDVPEGLTTWWCPTYDALDAEECDIQDGTLERLLNEKTIKPKAMEETVLEMVS